MMGTLLLAHRRSRANSARRMVAASVAVRGHASYSLLRHLQTCEDAIRKVGR